MAFKMRGIGALTNSPLASDPTTKNTAFTTNLAGDKIPTEREITKITEGNRTVEKKAVNNDDFLKSFSSEYANAKKEGFEGTLPQYIKQKTINAGYGDKVEKIIQKRELTNLSNPSETTETIERPATFFEGANTGFNWTGKADFNSEGGEEFFKYFDNMARTLTETYADREEFNRSGNIRFNDQAFRNGGLFDTRVGPGQSQHLVYKLMDLHRDNPKELEMFFRKKGFVKDGESVKENIVTQQNNVSENLSDWQTIND